MASTLYALNAEIVYWQFDPDTPSIATTTLVPAVSEGVVACTKEPAPELQ